MGWCTLPTSLVLNGRPHVRETRKNDPRAMVRRRLDTRRSGSGHHAPPAALRLSDRADRRGARRSRGTAQSPRGSRGDELVRPTNPARRCARQKQPAIGRGNSRRRTRDAPTAISYRAPPAQQVSHRPPARGRAADATEAQLPWIADTKARYQYAPATFISRRGAQITRETNGPQCGVRLGAHPLLIDPLPPLARHLGRQAPGTRCAGCQWRSGAVFDRSMQALAQTSCCSTRRRPRAPGR